MKHKDKWTHFHAICLFHDISIISRENYPRYNNYLQNLDFEFLI